jgi:hypothetical protein
VDGSRFGATDETGGLATSIRRLNNVLRVEVDLSGIVPRRDPGLSTSAAIGEHTAL